MQCFKGQKIAQHCSSCLRSSPRPGLTAPRARSEPGWPSVRHSSRCLRRSVVCCYLQSEGGPIGQRPTMAASRIVTQQWYEDYEQILTSAGLETPLLKVYVDDGRQVTTLLRKGMRYCQTKKEFTWSKEAQEEDEEKQEKGEDKNTFMARLCKKISWTRSCPHWT